jgi:aspartyl-tRNA(Asn)/glutamyl-tRNA(Gln) amidotransferase subunit C
MPMSVLSSQDVLHLARLANLRLKKQEVDSLKKELSEVLNYFSKLQKLDTEGQEPTSQTTGLVDVFRSDEVNVVNTLTSTQSLSGSQKSHNDYFIVPAVIDKEK